MSNPSAIPQPYAPVIADPAAGDRFGRVALVLAIITVATQAIWTVVTSFLPTVMYNMQLSSTSIAALFAVVNLVHTIFAAATLVFGLLGLRGAGRKVAAGIGVGVGGAGVIVGLVSLIIVPLVGFAL
ncbi:hypothetical protein BH11ACT3_BH11ACT3_09380 [soil metagenome]